MNEPRLTKLVAKFDDGTEKVFDAEGEQVAWLTSLEAGIGWYMVGTEEVDESVVLNFAYDMIDAIEGDHSLQEQESNKDNSTVVN